jgi:hypothetical protein
MLGIGTIFYGGNFAVRRDALAGRQVYAELRALGAAD